MTGLRLAIFDVDGTLVDSQGHIVAAMGTAFAAEGLTAPTREDVLSIVGLSLPVAMAKLGAELSEAEQARLVAQYKDAYAAQRMAGDAPMLYPGIADLLRRLSAQDDLLLGVATGKSRRGLDFLIAAHGLKGMFVTRQVADDHPSKPHPSMVMTALSETGCDPKDAVMIGDTTYDVDMGHSAGVATIGVSWGYHPRTALIHATEVVDDVASLDASIARMTKVAA